MMNSKKIFKRKRDTNTKVYWKLTDSRIWK